MMVDLLVDVLLLWQMISKCIGRLGLEYLRLDVRRSLLLELLGGREGTEQLLMFDDDRCFRVLVEVLEVVESGV
jgi:hypothetical protein